MFTFLSKCEEGKLLDLAWCAALNRTKWAKIRNSIIASGDENAESLTEIESSLFHYWLDEETISTEKFQEGVQKLA